MRTLDLAEGSVRNADGITRAPDKPGLGVRRTCRRLLTATRDA